MNTNSSRSHTIVQFTISSTTGETADALRLSRCGNRTGKPVGDNPAAASKRRRPNHPVDNNIDDIEDAGSEICNDSEIVHDASTDACSGAKSLVFPAVATRAKLSLVDLAGSEKGRVGGERDAEKTESRSSPAGSPPAPGEDDRGAQERERSRINASLSALSNCISCLGEAGRKHIPFRDNPLTR